MICIDLVPVSHPWCHAHVWHAFISYVQCLSLSAQFLASQQLLPQASGPCLARLASMVTLARAHMLAVATRVAADEAASLDAQLGNRGFDYWARQQRQRLEEMYAAVEQAGQALHEYVTSTMEQLEAGGGLALAIQ